MELIATALVVLVLSASIYLGLSNADDVLNTITVWQRLVGITATTYGLTAIVALYAVWARRAWLVRALLIWAVLVVFTATLAAAAYGQAAWSGLLVALVSAAVVTPVVLYGRRRVRGWARPVARGGPAA
jgi:hypothetical protein